MRSVVAAIALICAVSTTAERACAVDNVWSFDGNGNWDEGAKWSLSIPAEGAGITAVIDDGDTAVTVTLDSSHSVDALSLGSNDTLLIESGASSVALTSGTSFTNAGTINVTGTDVQATILQLSTVGDDTLTNTGTLNFQVGAGSGIRIFTGSLVNSGSLNVNYDATFNKSGATYTNNGRINVASGRSLTISNNGNLTNFAGTTLTGGIFDLAGTILFPDANIQTSQAEIILRGANGAIRNSSDNSNALSTLANNGVSGKLRLLEGQNFQTAASVFTQSENDWC
jgi:hypothetical protein